MRSFSAQARTNVPRAGMGLRNQAHLSSTNSVFSQHASSRSLLTGSLTTSPQLPPRLPTHYCQSRLAHRIGETTSDFPKTTTDSSSSKKKPLPDELLEKLVIHDGTSGHSYPNPLIDSSKLKLKYYASYHLSRIGDKAITVVCPHPGSITYLEDVVGGVGGDLGAMVLSLDYLSFVELAGHSEHVVGEDSSASSLARRGGRGRGSSSRGEMRHASKEFVVSPSFSPVLYSPYLEVANLPQYKGEEDDDLDDDLFGDENEPWNRTSNPQINLRLVVSPNLLTRKGPFRNDVGDHHPGASLTMDSEGHTHVQRNQNGEKQARTFYHAPLSSAEVTKAANRIKDFIESKAAAALSAGKNFKFMLFFKDVTDTLESGGGGQKVMTEVMEMIRKLREESRIPVILVAGCSPGLLPFYQKSDKEISVKTYKALFTEKLLAANEGPAKILLGKDGAVFSTCLDWMKDQFEKIEIPPPAPELASSPLPLAGNTSVQEAYEKWLVVMQESLAMRFKELNWRYFCKVCKDRNVIVRGIDLEDILNPWTVDRTRMPEKLPNLLKFFEGRILDTEDIARLVSLALGFRFDLLEHETSHTSVGLVSHKSTIDINAIHLEMALQLFDVNHGAALVGAGDKSETGADSEKSADAENGSRKEDGKVKGSDATKDAASQKAEEAATSLKQDLEKKGHKLSHYEVKLLGSVVQPDSIKIGFQDVILPPPTKLMLQTIVTLPLLRPEMFSSGVLSKHAVSGVLLFGPPGTGKTMLGKAVAKSCQATFMSVAASDIYEKYVGEGEKNVRALFSLARKLSPCVVFIDEVDSIFGSRRSESITSRREIVNEFMSEWDGLTSKNQGVIIMGATNRPFDLDDAILRRMPRRVLVDLPTEAQRLGIMTKLLEDEKLSSDLDIKEIAKKTAFYSGSDLKNLTLSAALAALKEHLVRESITPDEPSQSAALSTEEVLKRADSIDDWANVLDDTKSEASPRKGLVRTLSKAHFDVAFKEVPPSLTDEMPSLIELRKWNERYGEGSPQARAAAKRGWGFHGPKEASG
ncbi:hypothetical protein HDU97_006071 [Phlyctochytrium planicorne]|nr:hypothetical protein HDU97_006071 [Phlyctochytrium planicorne]